MQPLILDIEKTVRENSKYQENESYERKNFFDVSEIDLPNDDIWCLMDARIR